jgi:eukaryotic-like serine/threonine-protein kinase
MTTPTSEPTPTPAATSLVGQVVSGRYRVRELIGEGGMGAVYLAEHTHMRKRVALKLLHAEMSKDEEVLARFRREAEAAARVEHPNVATATDFGQTEDGSFFLVLEYVEGTSLRANIDKGPIPSGRGLHIARQIGLALERAHAAGIVHRDLKPENVMLVRKGDDPDFVKVLDFGIAKLESHATRDATQPLTRFGTILGTPEYMAPEQALGETVGPGADLYAVGVMLYEMLTGKHPFHADERMAMLSMHIVAPVPPMTDRNPAVMVPPALEELVRQLLEKDAKARPPSARALIEAIDATAATAGVALPSVESSPSLARVLTGTRESQPGDAAPTSSRVPDSSWNAGDALAKTDYGVPVSTPAIAGTGPAKHPDPQATTHGPRPIPAIERLRPSIERIKALPRVFLAIVVAIPVVVLLLIVVLILVRRSSGDSELETNEAGVVATSGSPAAPPRSTRATPEQIRAAASQGPAALEALGQRFPTDAAIQRELVLAWRDQLKLPEALVVVRNLARLDKNSIDDEVVGTVVAAAMRADTADEAFALLESVLGARGVDALIEFSTNKTTATGTKARATRSLGRADVRANASPAAAVYLELKAATTCAARKELLERAQASGDGRSLAILKSMKSPRGCGFMGIRDCWACLRRDDALDDAIRAVEARPSK